MTTGNEKPKAGSKSEMASAIRDTLGGIAGEALAATSITREQFVKNAVNANLYEIEAAKIALDRTHRAEVKELAEAMLADHEKMGRELGSFIGEANIPEMPPQSLDRLHQTLIDDLNGAADVDFDKRYVEQQKLAHTNAITLFKTYHHTARDDGLRSLIGLALPVLEGHMKMVRDLESRL